MHITTVLAAVWLILSTTPAYAQWWRFGPKNFGECVLEKMKEQPPNMIQYARKACRDQFPEERMLDRGDDYDVAWCDTDKGSISACLTLKGNHKVVRAEAWLSRQDCDAPNADFETKVTADPPLIGSTYKFQVPNAQDYRCARFSFIGYRSTK